MNTEERLKLLLAAPAETLKVVDAALAGPHEPERPASLRMWRLGAASRETSISRTTLWRAIKENRLRAVEVRKGSRRIPEVELRRFVEGR